MAALVFNKCCVCIELKTGCLIIGYLQLIGEIIAAALILVGLVLGGALASSDAKDEQDEVNKQAGLFIIILMAILLIFLILALGFTISLLVGLHKGKRGHVKAYLVYATIFLVISVVMFFANFANKPINVGSVFNQLFNILLNIYFLLVIRSYYIKMGDTSKGPAVYSTA